LSLLSHPPKSPLKPLNGVVLSSSFLVTCFCFQLTTSRLFGGYLKQNKIKFFLIMPKTYQLKFRSIGMCNNTTQIWEYDLSLSSTWKDLKEKHGMRHLSNWRKNKNSTDFSQCIIDHQWSIVH
jgi:hypothetical protein